MQRLTTCKEITKDTDMTQEAGYSEIYKRLAEFEDAQQQGRLVFRPCRMGETIYMITKHNSRMPSRVKITELMESNYFRVLKEFGKTVFLTHKEAQAALNAANATADKINTLTN